MVDRDGVISKTEDTVEPYKELVRVPSYSGVVEYSLAEGEGETRFLGSFSEVLSRNLDITNAEDIVGDEALHGTSTILNRELGTIRLVCRGLLRVVLGVQEASNRSALYAWNPEVTRTLYQS